MIEVTPPRTLVPSVPFPPGTAAWYNRHRRSRRVVAVQAFHEIEVRSSHGTSNVTAVLFWTKLSWRASAWQGCWPRCFSHRRVSRQDAPPLPAKIEFNRDVRPILSDNCFHCHGPDANHRKADLRLDLRDEAVKAEAFVPGKPDESELIERIFSDDADDLMPPPDSHKKLTERQKEILKRWIAQGAEYQQHWAYEPPVKTDDSRRPERRRCPGAQAARGDRTEALAGGRPPHADPAPVFGPARPAADAGGSARVRERPVARRLRATGRARAWQPALRRTHGASAGWMWCGSPTPSAITATIRAMSGRIATGSSELQRQQAFDRFTHRADRGRPAAGRQSGDARRLGLQPAAAHHRGRRRAGQGLRGSAC